MGELSEGSEGQFELASAGGCRRRRRRGPRRIGDDIQDEDYDFGYDFNVFGEE